MGRCVGLANYPNWRGKIYPFRDDPTHAIEVIFYQVPVDRDVIPASVFGTRWFDAGDGWARTAVGTCDPDEMSIYRGPLPPSDLLGPVQGSAEEWARGTLKSVWMEGGYGPELLCVHTDPSTTPIRLDGKATCTSSEPPRWSDLSQADGKATGAFNASHVWPDHHSADGKASARFVAWQVWGGDSHCDGRATSSGEWADQWESDGVGDSKATVTYDDEFIEEPPPPSFGVGNAKGNVVATGSYSETPPGPGGGGMM